MVQPDTRARILSTASSHFARHGFEGASLRKIGDDAGISAASIFHHFPGGKRELYESMLEEITDTLMHRVIGRSAANAGLCAADAVVEMLAAFWDYFEERPEFATVILLIGSGMDQEFVWKLEAHRVAMISTARQLLEAAQARGDLPRFEVDEFLLRNSAYMLTVHGARLLPAFLDRNGDRTLLRARYLERLRAELR